MRSPGATTTSSSRRRRIDPAQRTEVLAGAADGQPAREHRKADLRQQVAIAHAGIDDQAAKPRTCAAVDMISPQ